MNRLVLHTTLKRMARIHALLCAGRVVNCASLARMLETCARTIQRDLDFMREELKLPISYRRERQSYVCAEPVEERAFGRFGARREVARRESSIASPLATLLDEQAAIHVLTICERHGLPPEHVLQAALQQALEEAVSSPRCMRSLVRLARVLASRSSENTEAREDDPASLVPGEARSCIGSDSAAG